MSDKGFEAFLAQPVCGTAQAAAVAINAERNLRRGLRAQTRKRLVEARDAVAAAITSWTVHGIPRAAAELALTSILSGTGDEAADVTLRESREAAVRQWASELDATIAASRRKTDDDLMWLSRSLAKRGLAAQLLGDGAGSEVFYRDAIEMLSGIWGADHLEVGGLLDDCGTLLLSLDRKDEAETMIARAKTIQTNKGFRYDTE